MNYRRACVFDQQEDDYLVVSTETEVIGTVDEIYDNERGLILVYSDIKTLYPWASVVWAEVA